MLHIEFSNKFETLLASLLAAMAAPAASPFVREEVIVPSAALRRRIELAAADSFGICSNVQFSFLAEWLWRQIGQVIDVAQVSPFKSPVLTWRVFHILGDATFVRDHPPLASYLRTADMVMRHDLASRTADLFDQYLTYRPDWLASWLDGKAAAVRNPQPAHRQHERWQAALWRRIATEIGAGRQHPSVAYFDAIAAMERGGSAGATLPPVAHVFCLPAMPPLYLSILQRLSRWIELRLYVLNPCQEYWFEIVDPRRLSYLQSTAGAAHHEVGNRLLASWGKQTRAHIELLFENAGDSRVDDSFTSAAEGTLLGSVQHAILALVDPEPGSLHAATGDRSIEVHVCHSLTRELEVLQDQLLSVLAGPDPPRPGDILVVTPNLQEAAPLIDAVFGTVPRARQIPFAITGRPSSSQNAAARALLGVLAVATSRFQASAVFELLQQPIVGRRFDVGVAELETIHRWIRQSGIRWGTDAQQRTGLDLPGTARHSFGDGLDRLFMGYALPSDTLEPLNGRLPAGSAEGSEALALGSFQVFVEDLERLRAALALPRTPAEWRQILLGATETFLAPVGDEVEDVREVSSAIRELYSNMIQGAADAPVPAEVLLAAVRSGLDDTTRGGVPTGAVTFAAMASLRSLPYRCIYAIGLNDGAFPSTSRPDEFDLMALAPRRGDRQRSLDERNLFLDLVLAARDRLYLSYTGRSVRDNSVVPPSVLVAELLDYVASACAEAPATPTGLEAARRQLVVEHPLQPFSVTYFDPGENEPRRRSFNDEYRDALKERFKSAVAAQMPLPMSLPLPARDPAAPGEDDPEAHQERDVGEEAAPEIQSAFFRVPLAPAGTEFHDVTLPQLMGFFSNPCRFVLKQRLGIELPQGDEELQDDEPFVPDWRARTDLARRMLPLLLEGPNTVDVAALARAGIEYPPGRLGDIELEREVERLVAFAASVRNDCSEPCLAPVSGTLGFTLDDQIWTLSGAFGDLRPAGLVRHRYDDVRARDYLAGWLAHLFLNAIAPAGVAPQTTWHSRDGHFVLPPFANAKARLGELMALYRKGLHEPLRFFPKSAWKLILTGSLSQARSAWLSTPGRPYGEERDPAYRLALRGVVDPLDQDFEDCAALVFAPLKQRIVDARLA